MARMNDLRMVRSRRPQPSYAIVARSWATPERAKSAFTRNAVKSLPPRRSVLPREKEVKRFPRGYSTSTRRPFTHTTASQMRRSVCQRTLTQVSVCARTRWTKLETGCGPRGAASAAVGATSDAMPTAAAVAATRAPIRRDLFIPFLRN
ncbi:hypothetical protein DMB66_37780 [Actinoplanes sp. ATCC 53533]|nr:hypothetical protein DMB66_37780 [Actinoplanes sp. ATCC 53533]